MVNSVLCDQKQQQKKISWSECQGLLDGSNNLSFFKEPISFNDGKPNSV